MRRYALPLFVANSFALATIGTSYLLYSRLLSAAEFGIYAGALAVGNLATLVLDGGVKVSIIKHVSAPSRSEELALLRLMLGLSVVLLAAVAGSRKLIAHFYPALANQTGFVASFTSVYLLTYPWIGLPTAHLERSLAYSRLAWIESVGLVLERGAPAVFLSFNEFGMYAFVWSLALGRLFRAVALARFHPLVLSGAGVPSYRSAVKFLREGAWYQVGTVSSLIRDNLHVLLVGPLYGAAWVGYYAWGLQLCMIASQIFVQVSARISLPISAQSSDFSDRWRKISRQVGLLTAITAPLLTAAVLVAPSAVHQLFADKWQPALVLLPFLFVRMLPGAASAPIGALVLVDKGARAYAFALWYWTLAEVLSGAAAVWLIGTQGLAISYAVAAWVGVYFLLHGLNRNTMQLFSATASAVFGRPALWASLVAALPFVLVWEIPGGLWLSRIDLAWSLPAVAALVICLYAIDSDLRSTMLRSRQ